MSKVAIPLLLVALCAVPSPAQSPADKLPTVTTGGNLNPEVVSDINAQLIWLLAAAPTTNDSPEEHMARSVYQLSAFGGTDAANQAKLIAALREFRVRHDAIAAEYNALIPSVAREDVWVEYRNFRVKVNDLVAETVRNLYEAFPESAGQFHTAIEETKRTIFLSAYKSSADPDYATSPRAAATGFTYIQGAVTGRPTGKHSAGYVTAVIAGMVPGCPGRVYPQVQIGALPGAWIDGPQQPPLEYLNYQATRVAEAKSGYVIAVSCAIAKAH